ncbi:hypothetical protein D3C71_936170 [compost metagenome]
MRVARFLGQQPQRAAIGHPAEIVEAPVDPAAVGEAVAGFQLRRGGTGGGDPAVLVVVGPQHDRGLAAIGVPADAAAHELAHHFQRAVALERVLAGLAAQLGQRVGGDAGQGAQRQRFDLAGDRVGQPEGVRLGIVAAHAGAGVFGFFVTGLGDVQRHLAAAAFFVALGLGHHDQVTRVGREHAVDDLDIGAEEDRCRCAGRVGLAPALTLVTQFIALGAVVAQGGEGAHLLVTQHVGLWRLGGILVGLELGDLAGDAAAGIPVEPVVAHFPDHAAIGGEVHAAGALVAAGELGERTAAQVAHEHVAIAHEGHALTAAVVDAAGRIQRAALIVGHLLRHAAGDRHAEAVAHRAALALERVFHLLAIPRPPGRFDRRPDPVRIGHCLFDGDRRGRGMGAAESGQQQQGQGQVSGHCGHR